mmetsp:Transcript_15573/g.32942  ORF Transcript_15573/g.32942 Transcript_15573/m.32942 type:complete len:479 (+) Transcript_15573:169-1605(+)
MDVPVPISAFGLARCPVVGFGHMLPFRIIRPAIIASLSWAIVAIFYSTNITKQYYANYGSFAGDDVPSVMSHPILQWKNNATVAAAAEDYDDSELVVRDDTTLTTDYPCFPHRGQQRQRTDTNNDTINASTTTTIVYLETAFFDLHSEIYYSLIHHLCSCKPDKDKHWKIDTSTIPHFYIGPMKFLSQGFLRILEEYNTTTCGPIFLGTPPRYDDPDLTIVTTSYPKHFNPENRLPKVKNFKKINDPKYIFICHEEGPPSLEENATNVFWLTPRHERYVVPSFFPPAIVQRLSTKNMEYQQQSDKQRPPIFLVMGDFRNAMKRNILSLQHTLLPHRNKNFTIRFMGGGSKPNSKNIHNELHSLFGDFDSKFQVVTNASIEEFMVGVSEVDVILPLVDQSNFHHFKGYQNGKKLTSSVMWAFGFHKKMVLYRPLAELFGVDGKGTDNDGMYYVYDDWVGKGGSSFYKAFGRCLDHLLEL